MTSLVASHVSVKRYLTWKNPSYYHSLSEASKKTLEFQGGKMSDEEAREFELDPQLMDKINLRLLDDEAKNEAWQTGSLDYYKGLMLLHLIENKSSS